MDPSSKLHSTSEKALLSELKCGKLSTVETLDASCLYERDLDFEKICSSTLCGLAEVFEKIGVGGYVSEKSRSLERERETLLLKSDTWE